MKTILCAADITACPELFAPYAEQAHVDVVPPDRALLCKRIRHADAYLATLHVRLDADLLNHAERLRAVATPSTGTDHLDLDALERRNIAVLSLKDDTNFLSSITATAELTWGLLLGLVRRIPWAFAAARQGEWARDRYRGSQLSGKTLGILGYGRLGRILAEYGNGFRMRVLANDVRDIQSVPGIEMVDLDTLLQESDVLSIHIHLTDETKGFVSRKRLACMKQGAILLNSSRGAIVDEAALLDALENGHLAGAAVDVLDGEWRTDLAEHPLIEYARTHENLLITPHIGGVALEAQQMALQHITRKLFAFF